MNDVEALREAIVAAQKRGRPLGMPPAEGLLYQPVPFPGFEDLGCERNSSEHRLQMIADWLGGDEGGADERLKVLDLGCANGYFLFRLEQLGRLERGLGVDHFEGNVETCRLLAEYHGLDRLSFRRGTVGPDLVAELTADESYDVALWLSVHHHIIRSAGIDAAQAIFRTLYDNVGAVIVEQGSLTDDEYRAWTSRDEPFTTRSFTRLLSMAEACGIPREHVFCVGMGRYLSGERDDMQGAGRTIVGVSKNGDLPRRIADEKRKAHKNGVYMEILDLGGRVWKNVVRADKHHARREYRALRRLRDEPGFVRCVSEDDWEVDGGFLRLERRDLRSVVPEDVAVYGLREQALKRLMSLASCGVVHGELHAEHLLLDEAARELIVLDLETARFVDESPENWWNEVAAENPALGLGSYPREAAREHPEEIDLLALDSVFTAWGAASITEAERREYQKLLAR